MAPSGPSAGVGVPASTTLAGGNEPAPVLDEFGRPIAAGPAAPPPPPDPSGPGGTPTGFGDPAPGTARPASEHGTPSFFDNIPTLPPPPTLSFTDEQRNTLKAPDMPVFQGPSMGMPEIPGLSPVAAMPFMGSREVEGARFNIERSIAGRAGRAKTFLTSTTRRASRVPTLADRRTSYGRTAG